MTNNDLLAVRNAYKSVFEVLQSLSKDDVVDGMTLRCVVDVYKTPRLTAARLNLIVENRESVMRLALLFYHLSNIAEEDSSRLCYRELEVIHPEGRTMSLKINVRDEVQHLSDYSWRFLLPSIEVTLHPEVDAMNLDDVNEGSCVKQVCLSGTSRDFTRLADDWIEKFCFADKTLNEWSSIHQEADGFVSFLNPFAGIIRISLDDKRDI